MDLLLWAAFQPPSALKSRSTKCRPRLFAAPQRQQVAPARHDLQTRKGSRPAEAQGPQACRRQRLWLRTWRVLRVVHLHDEAAAATGRRSLATRQHQPAAAAGLRARTLLDAAEERTGMDGMDIHAIACAEHMVYVEIAGLAPHQASHLARTANKQLHAMVAGSPCQGRCLEAHGSSPCAMYSRITAADDEHRHVPLQQQSQCRAGTGR